MYPKMFLLTWDLLLLRLKMGSLRLMEKKWKYKVAVGVEVGSVVSDESDGAICSGDSDVAEDEAEPNSNFSLEEFEDLGVKVRENIPHNVVSNTGSGAEMEGQNVVKGSSKAVCKECPVEESSTAYGCQSTVSGGQVPRQGFQSAAQPAGGRDPPRLDDQGKRQKKSTATIEDKADSGVEAVQAVTEADVEENEEVKNTGSLLAYEDLEMADSKKGPSLAESDSKDGFEKMIRSESEEDELVSSVGENGVTPTVRVSEVGAISPGDEAHAVNDGPEVDGANIVDKEGAEGASASPSDKGVKPSWANIVEGRGGTNADKKTEEALGVEGMGLDFVGLNGKGDVIEAKEKGGSRDLGSGSFHPEESERGFSPVEDYKVEFIQFITALLFWLGTWISATDFGPATSASYFRERIWFWFVMHISFLLLRGLLGNVLRILWALANAAEVFSDITEGWSGLAVKESCFGNSLVCPFAAALCGAALFGEIIVAFVSKQWAGTFPPFRCTDMGGQLSAGTRMFGSIAFVVLWAS
ncbi:hypothetical protein U1Q18_036448 [Sarracenia purpurea var. burkii]